MQGSFTPDSAEKFLELMREAGYETSDLTDTGKSQNFSEGVRIRGGQQFVANFSEDRGEYIENYDYTRCVKPDGSAYGTAGQCRKGVQEEKDENDAMGQLARMLPKGSKIVGSSGETHTTGAKGKLKTRLTDEHWVVMNDKWKEIGEKLNHQRFLLKHISPSSKSDEKRKAIEEKVEKLSKTFAKLTKIKKQISESLDKAGLEGMPRPLIADNWTPNGPRPFPRKARVSQSADPNPSEGVASDKKKRGAKPGGMRVTEKIKALGAEDLKKVLSDPRLNERQKEQLNKLLVDKETAGSGTKKGNEKPLSTPTTRELNSMSRDELYEGKGAFKPGTGGHFAYKNEIDRRHELVYGLRKKGLSEKEIATQVWDRGGKGQAGEAAPKRELRGQELANAMVLHSNIAERVRAYHGGSLATKKARTELQAALDKEGALNRKEINRMLEAQKKERK